MLPQLGAVVFDDDLCAAFDRGCRQFFHRPTGSEFNLPRSGVGLECRWRALPARSPGSQWVGPPQSIASLILAVSQLLADGAGA